MEILRLDSKKQFDEKKKNFKEKQTIEKIKKFNNLENTKITYLNIDSSQRNKSPGNVIKSNLINLPSDPITVYTDSNSVRINFPNHDFSVGDKIMIQNVEGKTSKLLSAAYLTNGFDYIFFKFASHGLDTNYLTYQSVFQVKIDLLEDITTSERKLDNIPFNSFLGIKDALLPSTVAGVPAGLYSALGITSGDAETDYFFVKLPYNFISLSSVHTITQLLKVSFLNVSNIPLAYINSNFPINYKQYQGYQQITQVEDDYFYFNSKIKAYVNLTSGGSKVKVAKVIKTTPGYPLANEYTIFLRNDFKNIETIELVDAQIPCVDFLIKSSGDNQNNLLYWMNIDDGDNIYNIEVPEGNYTTENLINKIEELVGKVERVESTLKNPVYNDFDITLDAVKQELNIISYKIEHVPDSITVSTVTIDSESFYQLEIVHANNIVEVDDYIEITGSLDIDVLPASSINKRHLVYSINKSSNSYIVLINYVNVNGSSASGNGGQEIVIKSRAMTSFLFNKKNTIGKVLGFKDVGEDNAITNYSHETSNLGEYIYSNSLDEVGNSNTSSNIINLYSENNYMIMYVNDFETISGEPLYYFAKILFDKTYYGNNDVASCIISNPYTTPIPTLTEIRVKFTFKDGTLPDFRNLENSFTLKIVEKISVHRDTYINSKDISYNDSLKELAI